MQDVEQLSERVSDEEIQTAISTEFTDMTATIFTLDASTVSERSRTCARSPSG
jgi:hypothetical protein